MSPESSPETAPFTSSDAPAAGASVSADSTPSLLELVIFVGLQAAGKTTFYQTRFAATHAHISKDLLRNNKRPERRQTLLIAEALAAGRSVVVDNTNATVAERATLMALGRAAGACIVGYYFQTTVSASLSRNAQRTGNARVPNVAIFARAKQLAPPTYAEGFGALYTVAIAEEGAFTVARIDEAMSAAQVAPPVNATSSNQSPYDGTGPVMATIASASRGEQVEATAAMEGASSDG